MLLKIAMKTKKYISIKYLLLISCITVLVIGCAGKPFGIDIINDPKIKSLINYHEIKVAGWKNTKIEAAQGDIIIITPLYPKGYIYQVKGRIGESTDTFGALDVDIFEIYKVETPGTLQIGIDHKSKPIHTGVFIFNDNNLDAIISDLRYLESRNNKSNFLNITLGIILKKKCERLIISGRNDEALVDLDKAIYCFRNVDEKLYSTTIYRLHKMKADIYKVLGDLERFNDSANKALDSLMRASRYYSRLKDQAYSFLQHMNQEERFALLTKTNFFAMAARPEDYRWGHGYRNIADAYGNLARYHSEAGNLRLSLEYAKKAIREAEKVGNNELIARAYKYLGVRHYFFGFFEEAEKALLTGLDHSSVRAEWNRSGLQLLLAFSQIKLRKFDSAERTLKKVWARTPLRYKDRQAYLDLAFGMLYFEGRDYDRAIPLFKRFYYRTDLRKKYFRSTHIYAALHLCESYLITGELAEALKWMAEVESEMNKLGNPGKEKLGAMLVKSKIMRKMKKDPVPTLMEAISSLEDIRPTALSSEDYEYWEDNITIYNETIECLYQSKDYVRALEVAEKARSRRFLDYLGSKRLGAKGPTGYLLSSQADSILESLSVLESDMLQAAEKARIKVRAVYEKGTRYSKKLGRYRVKLEEAAKMDGQFGVTYNIVPVSPTEIQKKMPSDLKIVEYYLSDDALYTWVIGPKTIKAVKREVSRKEIQDLIKAFRASISVNAKKRGIIASMKTGKSISDPQRKLYEILFSPIEEYLDTGKIVIVPYGILNYLPFQALSDGTQYLIEKYSIRYIPSLSVLQFLKKKKTRDGFKILALGNPDLDDPKLALPAAQREVETIKAMFPSSTVLVREDATEANVKRLAQKSSIFHFACHGEYIPQAPLASCIRLVPGDGEDGRLEAEEIFDMNINADLVVTSACQTAIGHVGKGDEVVGLTRAFIYAGANSVLASLWNISDEATSLLMTEFYSNINSVDNPEALRKAQLKMIHSKEYSDAFYWAPFVLTSGF